MVSSGEIAMRETAGSAAPIDLQRCVLYNGCCFFVTNVQRILDNRLQNKSKFEVGKQEISQRRRCVLFLSLVKSVMTEWFINL